MKYLLWMAIGVMVFYWVTRSNRLARRPGRAPADPAASVAPSAAAPAPGGARSQGRDVEEMLPCAHCGVHVPASEAIPTAAGPAYCSQAHRLLHEPR